MFEPTDPSWAAEHERLRGMLDDDAYEAARRTTINAHYTDPAYVQQIWLTLTELGFTQGRVLEPGCGSGTFIGLAPDGAQMVGVELDPTTAAIAQKLYPEAQVRAESFADTRYPDGHFDAVVGNVPFADVSLHDPRHNADGHSIHNHFIIKSLALTRPGGLVAVLTSRYTMDAANPAARREMNRMADLVGAVRLPTGAHKRAAGTEALTDLLIFQRRAPGTPPRDLTWETVTPREIGGTTVRINNYYDAHPDHVLGQIQVGTGMYGAETLHVITDDLTVTDGRLAVAAATIVEQARDRGHRFTELTDEAAASRAHAERTATDLWDGTIVAVGDGFKVAHDNRLEDLPVPKSQRRELGHLLELRDSAKALLEAESAEPANSTGLTIQRNALLRSYETYVDTYGPLNRFKLAHSGRYEEVLDPVTGEPELDPATGEPVRGAEIMRRLKPPVMAKFRHDPHSALVKSLEQFDEETQTSAPAALLRKRLMVPRPAKLGADTPAEAIALSLDRTGGIDLPLVAKLLGTDPEAARSQLGDLVYDDPVTGELVHAPDYLSGDVRSKLDAAEEAAHEEPDRYRANVDALRKVQPDPIGVDEIEARLGAVWISPEIHQQFLRELLEDRSLRVENPMPGKWDVRGRRHGMLATNEWGTDRKPAPDIANALMDQRQVVVKDEYEDAEGRTRKQVNAVETTAAQEKGEALQERFAAWVWEDPARATELAEIYNRRFNSIRIRDYSQAGDYLTLPGMADTLTLRPHQRAAVARMIAEPSVGLFHQVGAGKTFTVVAGVTEMRRMGLVSKPCVVVPNHMLEQFSREWLHAYPQAKILAASTDDLKADRRRLFVAKAAANDWDAVILTQGAFKTIGVSPAFEARYVDEQLAELRESLAEAKDGGSMSVKQIEKAVLRMEQEHKKKLSMTRDPGISFEETGIDYLVIDEAHMYKNLTTVSKIPGAAIAKGSQQAADLHMKLEYLREKHGDRVATFATATPLANSVTEAHVMQRYLRPDLLEAAGVTSFDGWAATFGSQVTEMEMGPAGGFRMKTRFAKFQNVPEMLKMWHVFADVKTSEDLNLEVPEIAPRPTDGSREPETVVLEPTPELEDYIANIAERAELVANKQVSADEDNMLLISTDGRKAALDLRLVDQGARPSGLVKLDAVADRILAHWRHTRDNVYLDEVTEKPSPVRGGLQLVFCDLGTPHETRWDAYSELKGKLIEGGMAPDAVRFMHDAKDDRHKARLFAAGRAGHVSVLIGSTAKMGVGTNVQNRLTAMHHVDCPWRPADLEQRDGRGIRWGNQNAEVAINRYVVERSFDAYSWQTVARKATFIAQVMNGKLDAREIEDIGDTALSAAEAKALASGNPLVLDRANADGAFQKLRRQQVAHGRAQRALQHTRDNAEAAAARATEALSRLRAAREKTIDTSGDAFRIRIGEQTITSRADAAAALTAWVREHQYEIRSAQPKRPMQLGEVGGHIITVHGDLRPTLDRGLEPVAVFGLADVPGSEGSEPLAPLTEEAGVGTIRALENKPGAIDKRIDHLEADLEEAQRTVVDTSERIGRPFPHAEELADAQTRLEEIDAALAELAKEREDEPVPGQSAEPATSAAGEAEVESVEVGLSAGAAAERRQPPCSGGPGGGGIPR